MARAAKRADLLRQAEGASHLVAFSAFAAEVSEQRGDVVRAQGYRDMARRHQAESRRLLAELRRCHPWWRRPRDTFREWRCGLFGAWSWRTDDPGRRPTRPGVEP